MEPGPTNTVKIATHKKKYGIINLSYYAAGSTR